MPIFGQKCQYLAKAAKIFNFLGQQSDSWGVLSAQHKIYFVSAECIVITSYWWRPKFHKLLTMRQVASVSSVYNSRKGCTAQYLAGAGVSLLTVFAVQKSEYFTLTFLHSWGPVEQGQHCLVELDHKSRSYYSNCPSTQPSLSLAEKSCKSWHLQSLVWQPFSSNPGIQQNIKIVWQTKSQKNSPRMLFFLTIFPNRGVVTRFKHGTIPSANTFPMSITMQGCSDGQWGESHDQP